MTGFAALPVFKALADETRLRILTLVTRFELNVGEIVAVTRLGQPRVSRHLRILMEAGLVRARRDGLWVFYSARQSETLGALAPLLADCGPNEENEDIERARQAIQARVTQTRRFFNAIAPAWRTMRREVLGDLDVEECIVSFLPKGRSMADLGCGPGELLCAMAKKASALIGVDASAAMLALAKAKPELANASLRMGELEHLPLADAEVQAAVLSLTLHHLSEPLAAIREARRVLAPGGTLVIADYLKHENERMRARFNDRWLGFAPQELAAWLESAGFVVEKTDVKPVKLGLELGFFTARTPNH